MMKILNNNVLIVLLLVLVLIDIITSSDKYDYDYKDLKLSSGTTISQIYTNNKGNLVILGDSNGQVYRSTDYGDSWKKTYPLADGDSYRSITGLIMTEKGDEIIVSTDSSILYYSNDYGATFSVRATDRECSISVGLSKLRLYS